MANTPAFALTTISGGINRLRTKGGADKNSLYDLLNGYVTQSSTVKVRPGTFRNANIAAYAGAGTTKGLLSYQSALHVFSSSAVPVPPGYALHVLNYPATNSLTSTVTRTPPSLAADPSWNSVALLAQFDGVDGSKNFVDDSNAQNPGAITLATLSAAAPKFGSTALNSAGSNFFGTNACSVPYAGGSQLDIFTGAEWTIEGWMKVTNNAAGNCTFCAYGDTGTGTPSSLFQIYVAAAGDGLTGRWHMNDYTNWGTTSDLASAPVSLVTGTWYHVACVSHAGTVTLYVGGVAIVTNVGVWVPASYVRSGATTVCIGSDSRVSGVTQPMQIDMFRVTAGVARYTANFTPPAAAFPAPVTTVTPAQIKEIHFSAPYLGGIYVVAEFTVPPAVAAQFGTVFHYWIQSSTGGDNSNKWVANANYKSGDVIIPTTPNGLTYIASRRLSANPTWTPNTAETVGNIVEPVAANGFQYACTATLGATPTTGAAEPTWPLTNGGTVNENSALAVDQTVTLATAANPTAPTTPTRYIGIAGGFTAPKP